MICVARKARRVSSKLWHGRKDDEYLGFWDTFVPSAFWASVARKPQESFDKRTRAKTKASYGNRPPGWEPNV